MPGLYMVAWYRTSERFVSRWLDISVTDLADLMLLEGARASGAGYIHNLSGWSLVGVGGRGHVDGFLLEGHLPEVLRPIFAT